MNKREITKILKERAQLGHTIQYGQINNMLDNPYDLSNTYQRHLLGEELGDISKFEHSQGRPLLSAIVIDGTTGMPGNGFFEMAATELEDNDGNKLFDPSIISKKKFLQKEQAKVFEFWKK